MRRIIAMLERIPTDKMLHLICGGAVALVFWLVCPIVWWVMLAVASVAVAKEIVDKAEGREFSIADIAATLLGGVAVVALMMI